MDNSVERVRTMEANSRIEKASSVLAMKKPRNSL
jgi:hypothetical protein